MGGATTHPTAPGVAAAGTPGDSQDSILLPTADGVAANASPTSLQLTLEDRSVQTAAASLVKGLPPMPGTGAEGADVVGFAFAVNGKLDGGDVYASHALLSKMYGKLLTAAALEAVIDQPAGKGTTEAAKPPPADVLAGMIASADAAKATPIDENGRVRMLVEQRRWANAPSNDLAVASQRATGLEPGVALRSETHMVTPTTRPTPAAPPAAPAAPTSDRAAVVGRSTDVLDEYETRDTGAAEPYLHRTYLAK